jgi:hypothetical protein
MLAVPNQVDPRTTLGPLQPEFPFGQERVPQSRHDRHIVLGNWGHAFILFDARIRMLQLWSTDVCESSSRLELDWCIACLADIRSALYGLHVCVVDQHLPLSPNGPAIVSYLSEAYVWCGEILDDVQALVQELRGGLARDCSLAEDASAYIDDFLDPLFEAMCDSSQGTAEHGPMRAFLPLAERLHVAIVSLDWVLKAA